jgi:single-stranded-DNA-specific exonuclease
VTSGAFVEASITGRRWLPRPACPRSIETLIQRHDLSEMAARILAGRGVDAAEAESVLDPTLRRLLPDPFALKDMRRGAERLARAVRTGEQVAVFADYDVDGATASAVVRSYLGAIGLPTRLYVPDRLNEGYGPSAEALLGLHRDGVALVVLVDCGISAFGPLATAAEAGLDVIAIDHHLAAERLPPAIAMINPNRRDEDGCLGHLAAVGLAFLFAVAVNRILRESAWFAAGAEPDLRRWLDLVALGTVCDMVPLKGVNRAFVTQGLKVMAGRDHVGLKALADVARIDRKPTPYHLGFVFGPRINAGGRVGQADLGARLLACSDPVEAKDLALRLDRCNRDRQAIEQWVLDQAAAQVMAEDGTRLPLLWAMGEDWHPGVIGIVAGRLAERFHAPALVIAVTGDRAVGSGRSLPGIDLGAAIGAAAGAGLLIKGGGHAMAAGFTAERALLPRLRAFLAKHLDVRVADGATRPGLLYDGCLGLAGVNPALAEALAGAGPFGSGWPEPRFVLKEVRVADARLIKDRHVSCRLNDGAGHPIAAIAFNAAATPLGSLLRGHAGRLVHLFGSVDDQSGKGSARVGFRIEDGAFAA